MVRTIENVEVAPLRVISDDRTDHSTSCGPKAYASSNGSILLEGEVKVRRGWALCGYPAVWYYEEGAPSAQWGG